MFRFASGYQNGPTILLRGTREIEASCDVELERVLSPFCGPGRSVVGTAARTGDSWASLDPVSVPIS